MSKDTATIADIIRSRKMRKGKSHGITSEGAFWTTSSITSYTGGGDGVGNSNSSINVQLEARHYRDGSVKIIAVTSRWHQNSGGSTEILAVGDCDKMHTVEDMIVQLFKTNDEVYVIEPRRISDIKTWAAELQIPDAGESPDDAERRTK